MVKRFSVAAAALAVTVILVAGGAAADAGFVQTGQIAQHWSPAYMSSQTTYTDAEAVALARSTDVVVAVKERFRTQVAEMKAANPKLRLLVYVNGTFAQADQGTTYPDSWYLRDANGNKVRSISKTWMMNPADAGWASTVAQLCTQFLASSGYDGCFLDNLGSGVIGTSFVTAPPINPATGQTWTAGDWMKATSALAGGVRTANSTVPVAFNGLGDGTRYWDPTAPSSALWAGSSIGMAETFLRSAKDSVTAYKPEKRWKKDVDMLADAESRGDTVLVTVKLWVTATSDQQAAWHKYALATFLLGANGRSWFSFLPDTQPGTPTADSAWDHVDVGTPSGAYVKVGGVYRRSFTKGLSLVNPTTATVTVALGGTYRTLDGRQVTSVTLAPNTGEVLTST